MVKKKTDDVTGQGVLNGFPASKGEYSMVTKRGYPLDEAVSALQKEVRRQIILDMDDSFFCESLDEIIEKIRKYEIEAEKLEKAGKGIVDKIKGSGV